MIHCPHCENDNEIGAIFCRTCGEKIDTDAIKPEQFLNKNKKGKGFSMGSVMQGLRNLVGLVFLVVVVVALIMVFLKPDFRAHEEMPEANAKATLGLLNRAKDPGNHPFTEEQVTQICRKMTYLLEADREAIAIDAEADALAPVSITANLMPNNRIRFILESSLKEKATMYTMVEGSVTATPTGLDFALEKAWAGKFPLHNLGDFGMDVARNRMKPLYESSERYSKLRTLVFTGLRSVTIDGTKLTLQR